MLYDSIADFEMIQANTDGITIRIKKQDKVLMQQVCKD